MVKANGFLSRLSGITGPPASRNASNRPVNVRYMHDPHIGKYLRGKRRACTRCAIGDQTLAAGQDWIVRRANQRA